MKNIIKLGNIPDFNLFKVEDLKNSFNYLIKKEKEKINELLEKDPSTVSWSMVFNTVKKEETYLNKLISLTYYLISTTGNSHLEKILDDVMPDIIDIGYSYYQNKEIYKLLKNFENKDLNSTQKLILKQHLKTFNDSGINLSLKQQNELKKLSEKLESLTMAYDANERNNIEEWFYHVLNEKDLSGIPEHIKEKFKNYAIEKNLDGYVIKLIYPYDTEILRTANNRELRKLVYENSLQIASEKLSYGKYDNTNIMKEIVYIRDKKAKMLGYKNHVDFSLSNKMAKNENEVLSLLNKIKDKAKPYAIKDLELISCYAKEKDNIELAAYDFKYYADQYKKEKLNFDTDKVKEYFPLEQVLKGLFWLIKELFDVDIEFKKDINENNKLYSIKKDNKEISYIIMDLFARTGKSSGAYVADYASYINNENYKEKAVAFLVCNFDKQLSGECLLSYGDVETLFHEIGHALHHTLTEVKEEAVSGMNVPFDAVELPSQLMEYFIDNDLVLNKISKHYKTGESIPENMVQKIKENKNFLISTGLLKQVEFGMIDLLIYNNPEKDHYETYFKLQEETNLFGVNKELRFLNIFSHIYSGGYAAGYYGYKYADVLTADVFEEFKKDGVISNKIGKKYLNEILSKGGSSEFINLFVNFKGREPNENALINSYNLK